MVFELLGATFVVSLIKMATDTPDLGFNDLLNTEKALSVILGIFLSVAIAFFFGTLVQFIARLIFSFNYRSRLRWKIGIFGGICATAIVYFLLIKGIKDLTFMTPALKAWIDTHTLVIILCCLGGFTVIMQLLHALRVNVLKVIVLMGTFALAMAFAGNDLVNFIGVPLSGLSAYTDYAANGAGEAHTYLMGTLNGPSDTSIWFLIGAGVVMVVSLATSRKARKVSQTEIGLGSQEAGDEMFGSSRIGRRLVRWTLSLVNWTRDITPLPVRRWINRRFDLDEAIMDQGAAFDLIRGSVNLVLAGALIALGTSMKLPLSTTFVTFMVAMGSSLADRAWGRESAVFRITGVISVIGGWFITAGAAFLGAGVIVLAMHLGGIWVMMLLAVVTVAIIIRSNRRFRKSSPEAAEGGDTLFRAIISTTDQSQIWPMLMMYITGNQERFMIYARDTYRDITQAFVDDDVKTLDRAERTLSDNKKALKNARRKETLCLRKLPQQTALEKSAWFYTSNNCCMSILYNLHRINEGCKEHVENNFLPLPPHYATDFAEIRIRITILFNDTLTMMQSGDISTVALLRRHCDEIKDTLSETYHRLQNRLHSDDPKTMAVLYVYLNMLQESQEMMSGIRKYLRAFAKLTDSGYSTRRPANA